MSDTSGAPTVDDPADARPLRILIGADTFAPDVNGAARFAERLAAGLVERGHDVHVMAPAASRTCTCDVCAPAPTAPMMVSPTPPAASSTAPIAAPQCSACS